MLVVAFLGFSLPSRILWPVTGLMQLVADLLLGMPGSDSSPVHVECIITEVEIGHILLSTSFFPCQYYSIAA